MDTSQAIIEAISEFNQLKKFDVKSENITQHKEFVKKIDTFVKSEDVYYLLKHLIDNLME